jgi:hypothetical protein
LGHLQYVPLKSNHVPIHVMAGLGPATHVLAALQGSEDVDARDKRRHDGGEVRAGSGTLRACP